MFEQRGVERNRKCLPMWAHRYVLGMRIIYISTLHYLGFIFQSQSYTTHRVDVYLLQLVMKRQELEWI